MINRWSIGKIYGLWITRTRRIKSQQNLPAFPLFPPCTNYRLTVTEIVTMYSRSSTGWSEWEEDNLLPWLEENSDLPWTDRTQAYSKQLGVTRSVESLRGKKISYLTKTPFWSCETDTADDYLEDPRETPTSESHRRRPALQPFKK
jgi:hypothetical protein